MKKQMFFVLSIALIFCGCKPSVQNDNVETMTQAQDSLSVYEISEQSVFEKIQNKEKLVLIDVRTLAELKQTGVLEGTLHIPLEDLSVEGLKTLNIGKEQEIVLYCRSGNRSREAYEALSALGFKNVKSMAGGIIAWQKVQQPLVDWSTVEKRKLFCMNHTECVN